jgi:hypothetical protein
MLVPRRGQHSIPMRCGAFSDLEDLVIVIVKLVHVFPLQARSCTPFGPFNLLPCLADSAGRRGSEYTTGSSNAPMEGYSERFSSGVDLRFGFLRWGAMTDREAAGSCTTTSTPSVVALPRKFLPSRMATIAIVVIQNATIATHATVSLIAGYSPSMLSVLLCTPDLGTGGEVWGERGGRSSLTPEAQVASALANRRPGCTNPHTTCILPFGKSPRSVVPRKSFGVPCVHEKKRTAHQPPVMGRPWPIWFPYQGHHHLRRDLSLNAQARTLLARTIELGKHRRSHRVGCSQIQTLDELERVVVVCGDDTTRVDVGKR